MRCALGCAQTYTVAMIPIEQWRARIGLFNNKRGCSGFASLLFSPVFFHYCYRKNVRSREYSSTTDTSPSSSSLPPAGEHPPTAHSTDLTSPAKSLNYSTTTSSFSSSSSRSGGLFSLRRFLLRDVLIILLITIISQQLLMSGDIETNPGPRRGADDKPGLDDLLYMSYTGKDGRDVHFRLMDQLKPHWRRLAIALKFPQHEIAIMENKDDPVYYILSEWLRGANQEKDPRPVTWRTLIEALRHANVQEEATVLEKHFIEIAVTTPNSNVRKLHFTDNATQRKGSFSILVDRLKQVYQAPPPTWDPLPQCGHIKLAMIREKGKRREIVDEEMVKHQMKGAVETIMASKVPVEKDNIFDSGLFDQERRVILVEGPPGGGKTSLAYYYGQKWASGNLSMFDIVAFVQLHDLAVTQANTLPDLLLLACCATKDDTLITKEMIQQYVVNCPKLLLVLDGWDEAPNDIRKQSYITSILHSITSQSKILITSRPDSSVELHGVANRTEILGFTEENVNEYFKEALSTELYHDKVEDGCRKLKEHFRSYPVIQSCCSIPLNAAILASLFLSKWSLPSTRHELFLKLVLSRINREQQRHSQRHIEYMCVSSLDDLPHDLGDQLNHLCVLAFEGVRQNKVVFTEENLVHLNLPHDLPGLGVLQIVDRLVATGGKTVYRHFIHLSIQELLAAYHISQLGEDEQVKIFESLLDEPRFSAVLQFYAAFTRFTNQGVRNIITEREFDSSQLRLLSFVRCFFEAQLYNDTSLYQQIIPILNGTIDLSHVTMTPLDCMSIGYFMASLLKAGGEVSVHLTHCHIDDHSLGLLVGEVFCRHSEVCPAGVMQAGVTKLDIGGNKMITEIGIAHVFRTNIANKLKADWCGISNLEMESLARALAANSTLEELDISYNNIGDSGIGHIATALLTNTTLKILNISKCVPAVNSSLEYLDTGSNHMNSRVHICTALQKNSTLKTLNFSGCGISDLVAESLSIALAVNSSLEILNIIDNNISDNGIVHIAKFLQKNNTLKVLYVGRYVGTIIPVTGLTDTGVLSLARRVTTNTSIERLSIRWSSTDPESTLKVMAESVKNSNLKILTLSIGMWISPSGEAPVGSVPVQEWQSNESEWFQLVNKGGNEFILSVEDSHLESLELEVHALSHYGYSLQFKAAVDSVNSTRHKKGLPNLDVSLSFLPLSFKLPSRNF